MTAREEAKQYIESLGMSGGIEPEFVYALADELDTVGGKLIMQSALLAETKFLLAESGKELRQTRVELLDTLKHLQWALGQLRDIVDASKTLNTSIDKTIRGLLLRPMPKGEEAIR